MMTRFRRGLAAVAAMALPIAAAPVAMHGQTGADDDGRDVASVDSADSTASVAPVPFGPGERMGYQVRLGVFGSVGEGEMQVVGIDTVRGNPSYHLQFDLTGSVLFASVDDRMQSWLDVGRLIAWRFRQDQDEVNYERHRLIDFYPERGEWVRADLDGDGVSVTGPLATDEPLDDLSFLYYARTLPLEVGETYTLDRYFEEDGNPVRLEVVRRDTVTVPAGVFPTVVVRPVIQTDGLFGEGGEAEVHFTDDAQRMLVMLSSRVPVLGSLRFLLDSYVPGVRLEPDGPATDDDDGAEGASGP